MAKPTPGRRLGSITDLGQRRWQVRIFLGRDASGTRQYRAFVVEGTRTDAEQALREKYAELRGVGKTSNGSTPLNAFFEIWLKANVALAPSSRAAYRFIWDSYHAKRLGHRTLGDVTLEDLEAHQDYLKRERKLQPRSVRRFMSLLGTVFRAAVERRMIPYSPSTGLAKPKVSKSPTKCWNPIELRTFLRSTKDTRWGPLWWLLATTGLRPGEALALEWKDLEGDRLRITKSLSRTETGGIAVGPTKTNTMRSVVLPKATVDLLHRARAEQDPKRPLMFATRVGTPFNVNNVASIFKTTSEALGMPRVTLYSLRHAHATDLLSRGVNPKIVSERLGHSTVSMTLDTYSHVLPSMQEGTAADLNTSLEDL